MSNDKIKEQLVQTQKLLESTDDLELKQMAEEEIGRLSLELIPKDQNDSRNVIMEIRAGTGGDEAELFAQELLRMYQHYAEIKGWKFCIVNSNQTALGGIKSAVAEIRNNEVYKYLKYESGVHRVQRVPKTEKSGRLHTSAATVAILPEAEEVDISINPKDLRIDTFRSGGHGGQNVNKLETAVRITYLPTNLVVECQDERSQGRNKEKAMTILRSKILEQREEEERKKRGDQRKSQIGTGDRSEKIRTYNFPQDRITDHRIKKSWNRIEDILNGNLDKITSTLIEEDQKRKIENMEQMKTA